ncbi:MAG TPA: GatB/YqeY domain-containing protein [Afifellaceae bacterium]|nr:GatB/YqeY domain-containing protein [Afifellaceae bacterium]
MMRKAINEALKQAMKSREKVRIATLRLINAAITDRDIEERSKGRDGISNDEIMAVLAKMIRQREESAKIYEENGRLEMAEQERQEIQVISDFLPAQMDEDDIKACCREVVEETGAQGLRDMGKCMATLKERYPGQIDFGQASTVVKGMLN